MKKNISEELQECRKIQMSQLKDLIESFCKVNNIQIIDDCIKKDYKNIFKCNSKEGIEEIDIDSIMYFEAQRNEIKVNCVDGHNVIFRGKISEIEEKCNANNIKRCHRSFVLNTKYIKKYANYIAYMKNGEEIPVGRKFYNDIKIELDRYRIRRRES